MNIKTLALALALAPAAIGVAHAATYTLTFTGTDFTGFANDTLTVTLNGLAPGKQGYTGGPLQTWAFSNSGEGGGWVDFWQDGETISIEADSINDPYMIASSPFFTTTAPGPWQSVSFPGITNNHGTEVIPLVNNECCSDSRGNADTLTIVAVPEGSTWALMAVGFAGLAFAGFRRDRATAIAL